MAATANIHAGNGTDGSSGSVRPVRMLGLSVAASLAIHASLFAAAFIWWQGEGQSVQRGMPQGRSVTFVNLVSQDSTMAKVAAPPAAPEKSPVKPKPVERREVERKIVPEPVRRVQARTAEKKPVEKQEIARPSQVNEFSQTSDGAASEIPSSVASAAAPAGKADGSAGASGSAGEERFFVEPHFRVRPQPPVYPRRARRLEQEGEALIRVRLDPRGNPAEVLVWRSSGFALLDSAALTAVRHWKFVPAERSGKPVVAWVEIPVRFALN